MENEEKGKQTEVGNTQALRKILFRKKERPAHVKPRLSDWVGLHLRFLQGVPISSSQYFKAQLGTLGAKTQLFIQKLPRIWCLKNVNFVKNEILKL